MKQNTRTLYLPSGGTFELPMPGNVRVSYPAPGKPFRGGFGVGSAVAPVAVAAVLGGAIAGLVTWALWRRA